MTNPDLVLAGSYNYWLVALSVFIAMLASYAALDLGERVTASHGRVRFLWLAGGSIAMGTGIWSMHYIGMLAYSLPVRVLYDWPMVLLSWIAAVVASAIALRVVSGQAMGPLRIGGGALLMGLGIAAMHYIGMEAMRLPAMCHYNGALVAGSVVLAVAISLVALWLTFHLRADHLRPAHRKAGWRKLASALLMGAAIPVMHYTGMAAVSFMPDGEVSDFTHSVEISSLGIFGIGSVTFLLLSLVIVTSLVDRRLSSQAMELELSEQRYRQLVDYAKVILWRGRLDTNEFSYVNQEAETLLGHALERWINEPGFWFAHVHPEDRARARALCEDTVLLNQPQIFEHRMLASDQRLVWLRTSLQMVTGSDGSHEIVGVMTDITERKQAQEAAEAASQAQCGLLLQIESLNEQLKRENTRMTGELAVSRSLHRMMLPRGEDLGDIGHLDISAFIESASEVGGDYYDVICEDGGVFLGIGDVTGHGLESGVIAIMVHTAVRTLLASGHRENQEFFEVLNRVIFESARRMNSDRNLTLSLLHYRDHVVTISGQHEEVLVVRCDGTLERHDTLNLGFHLGLTEDISGMIDETRIPLRAGDAMVVYTDGLTEAIDCFGVTYGINRLAEAVRQSHHEPAEGIREAILRNLREYIGGQPLLDDLTLVVVKSV